MISADTIDRMDLIGQDLVVDDGVSVHPTW
jgi:hypothetical protein